MTQSAALSHFRLRLYSRTVRVHTVVVWYVFSVEPIKSLIIVVHSAMPEGPVLKAWGQ